MDKAIELIISRHITIRRNATAKIFAQRTGQGTFVGRHNMDRIFHATPIRRFLANDRHLTVTVGLNGTELRFGYFQRHTSTFHRLLRTLRLGFIQMLFIPFIIRMQQPNREIRIRQAPLYRCTVTDVRHVTMRIGRLNNVFRHHRFFLLRLIDMSFTQYQVFFSFLVRRQLNYTQLINFIITIATMTRRISRSVAFGNIARVRHRANRGNGNFQVIHIGIRGQNLGRLASVDAMQHEANVRQVENNRAGLIISGSACHATGFVAAHFQRIRNFLGRTLPNRYNIAISNS